MKGVLLYTQPYFLYAPKIFLNEILFLDILTKPKAYTTHSSILSYSNPNGYLPMLPNHNR